MKNKRKRKFDENHNWNWRNNEKIICRSCGKEFIRKSQNNIFCSINCGQKYRRKHNNKRYKEYDKKKYLKDKEKVIKRVKKYREKNKEKILRKGREFYQKNKSEIIEKGKKYRKENPNKTRERAKKFYKNNKQHFNKLSSKWRKNNPEKEKAMRIANNNIKIPKNQLCEICNERKASIKHHEDYSKPLEIKFVCARCHKVVCHG